MRTMTGNCYINRKQKNTIRTMTGNCYINIKQKTQQELGQRIATVTENKKRNKNYDRELLH